MHATVNQSLYDSQIFSALYFFQISDKNSLLAFQKYNWLPGLNLECTQLKSKRKTHNLGLNDSETGIRSSKGFYFSMYDFIPKILSFSQGFLSYTTMTASEKKLVYGCRDLMRPSIHHDE